MFRAAGPHELLGAHAALVERALAAGEPIHYLAYSPMWQGDGGPFGIRAAPASHAAAATDRRFLISSDRHEAGVPPTIVSIPFDSVLSIASGSALVLAWLVIRYANAGSLEKATLLYRALGRKHFGALARVFRSVSTGRPASVASPTTSWSRIRPQIGDRYAEELELLLVEDEVPLSAASWPPLRGRRRRRRGDGETCVAPAGALVATSHGVFFLGDDPRALPRSPNFGINVLAVPYRVLQGVSLVDRTTDGACVLAMRLEIGRTAPTTSVEIAFPGEDLAGVANALAGAADATAARDVTWSF